MVRLARSTSRIWFILTVHRTMLPPLGRLPPLKPVPLPRVTTAVCIARATLSTPQTCSRVRGKTTQPGSCCIAAVPSKEYAIRSSFAASKFSAPTTDRSRMNSSGSGAIKVHLVNLVLGLAQAEPRVGLPGAPVVLFHVQAQSADIMALGGLLAD